MTNREVVEAKVAWLRQVSKVAEARGGTVRMLPADVLALADMLEVLVAHMAAEEVPDDQGDA